MSSEASHGGHGSEAILLSGTGSSLADGSPWRAVERRVLLTKLQDLERRARRLEYLETRLRDLNHEVQLLNRLGEATHAIHNATDCGGLFRTALEQCLGLLRAERGSILLYEPASEEFVVARVCGPCPVVSEGKRLPVGQGVAGYVARMRQALCVADIQSDGRFPVRDCGSYATGSFVSVPIGTNGTFVGVLNVADRSDQRPFSGKDLRTAMAVARELAAAVDRVRRQEDSRTLEGQFFSKLAHELRNPLDGALRFINLTLADQHPEERRRRYLMASKQGLERLTSIVNSLTGMGRQPRSDEETDINELITQAVVLQEGKAEERSIRVHLDLQPSLPPVTGCGGLFQVFTNLVSNAYDAMEKDGGVLSVTSRQAGDTIAVRFADTGPGMPLDVVERIFAPFFTTKRAGKGMGLGLAVCREIAARLGGRIDVASEPGTGTTFTLSVPCVPARAATELQERPG